MEPILTGLAQHGIPGLVIAALLYWVWTKDRDLKSERDARIKDAQDYTALALKLQAQAIDVATKLTDVFDEIKRLQPPRR